MNKKLLSVLIIVIVVLAVAIGGYFYIQNKDSKDATPTPVATATPQLPVQQFVTISNTGYSPAEMTVKSGTAITWTNRSDTDQSVVSSDQVNGPSSPVLSKSESFTFVFTTPGTYTYSNPDKTTQKGTITVTP